LVSTYSVINTVSNLSPGGIYHYRMVCSNAVAVTFGADVSFTTGTSAPPTTVTLAADTITSGGARLNGQVNPNGSTSTVSFEYGTTTNYGTTVVLGSIGNGFSPLTLNLSIFGLPSSTTHHFRVVGQSLAGTNYGADLTFATSPGSGGPAAAPVLSLLTLTNNQFSFLLTGTAGTNYIVQTAVNLSSTNWISLLTNPAPFTFTELNASAFAQKFYRGLVAP